MTSIEQLRRRIAFTYMGVAAFVCAALMATYVATHSDSGRFSDLSTGMFWYIVGLSLVSRFLSFTVGKANITLDTPVLMACAFHLGAIPTMVLIGISGFFFSIYRLVGKKGWFAMDLGRGETTIRFLFAPVITAAIGCVIGHYAVGYAPGVGGSASDFVELSLSVFAAAGAFLVLQYSVVLIPYILNGAQPKRIFLQTALPGLAAEFALMPLTILFVWTFRASNPFPFLVLGATSLMFADVFQRLSRARAKTLATVGDLERLIKTGERVFAILNPQQVVQKLSSSIAEEIPHAETSISAIWDEEEKTYLVDIRSSDGTPLVADSPRQRVILDLAQTARVPTVVQCTLEEVDYFLAVVPFILGKDPEGYIAALLPQTKKGSERLNVGRAALAHLRQLASIAGIAIHNARLYRMATVDGLTGLFVRRYFDRRYTEEVSRCARYRKPVSVLLIDLDNFKEVNDRFGHQVGDRVLQAVAATCQQNVRDVDVPCRYGGDEFVILLPETDAEAAREIADRLRTRIAGMSLLHRGQAVQFTASIGVSTHSPSSNGPMSRDLLETADRALYLAKQAPSKSNVVSLHPGEK